MVPMAEDFYFFQRSKFSTRDQTRVSWFSHTSDRALTKNNQKHDVVDIQKL